MSLRVWGADELRAAIDPGTAVRALRRRLLEDPPAADRPLRGRYRTRAGELLVMPDESAELVGTKLVSLAAGNPAIGLPSVQGIYVLMDSATLTPRAVLDAAELTLIRTAAMSLLVAAALAPTASPRVVVLGSGPQAVAHARAARLLEPSSVGVVVRSDAAAGRVRMLAQRWSVPLDVVPATAVREADVVLCCTASPVPVLESDDIDDDCVVVAVGSHSPGARELPTALMQRAWVVVDSPAAARTEAGDVIVAEAEAGEDLLDAETAALVREEVRVPSGRPRVFKSLGEAWQDLAVATEVLLRQAQPGTPRLAGTGGPAGPARPR